MTMRRACLEHCQRAMRMQSTDGRTDGRTENGGTSHLDRYRFLTANRRETTGNGGGSAR